MPFRYNKIVFPSITANRWDHFSIFVSPTTSIQDTPSKTENFGTCCGEITLFIVKENDFSFEIIANSAEPLE